MRRLPEHQAKILTILMLAACLAGCGSARGLLRPPTLSVTDQIIERYEREKADAKVAADAEADRQVEEAYIQSKADTSKTMVATANWVLWPMSISSALGLVYAFVTRSPKTGLLAAAGLIMVAVFKGLILRWGVVFVDLAALLLILGLVAGMVLAVAWVVPWARARYGKIIRADIDRQGMALLEQPEHIGAATALRAAALGWDATKRKSEYRKAESKLLGVTEPKKAMTG